MEGSVCPALGGGQLKIEKKSCHEVTYTIGTGDSADGRESLGREGNPMARSHCPYTLSTSQEGSRPDLQLKL